MRLSVLHEDNHLLVVVKPAGLLAQPDATGDRSLVELAQEYRKQRERKAGKAYIGLVHRLDRPVGGVMVLAKTSKAAARLASQFRARSVTKRYWALVEPPRRGSPADTQMLRAPSGYWIDQLIKDTNKNLSRVDRPPADDARGDRAREARTDYRLLARGPAAWLIELLPRTGRGHQLRVQLAARGLPILGDLRYGASRRMADGMIALFAVELELDHPVTGARLRFRAPPPVAWRSLPIDFARFLADDSGPSS